MAIPPSIPVVQNLAHLAFPPSKTEIWLWKKEIQVSKSVIQISMFLAAGHEMTHSKAWDKGDGIMAIVSGTHDMLGIKGSGR